MKLEFLFPTPVGIIDNENPVIEEHSDLLNVNYISRINGGMLSEDTYILNSHAPNLKNWILECVQKYAHDALAISDPLSITQSWCIRHLAGPQTLYNHMHPNSIISGAYYINAPEGSEPLKIHKPLHSAGPVINWNREEEIIKDKPWTWAWMNFKTKTGRLILFPSQLYHSVEGFENYNQGLGRCVLAFNTWFAGPFGTSEQLYRLDTRLNKYEN